MKKIKETAAYDIYAKHSGRYAVKAANKQWLHGDEKTTVLQTEGLVKVLTPKAPPPAEEAPAAEGEAAA